MGLMHIEYVLEKCTGKKDLTPMHTKLLMQAKANGHIKFD
jgi:hypothetical protein